MSILKENQQASDVFFITLKAINNLPIFINKKYYKIILNSLTFCRKNKGWKIYAYTVLINHLHLVLRILPNFTLSDAVRDFKSFTSKQIIRLLREDDQWDIIKEMEMSARNTGKQNYKVWRKNVWPKEIETEKFFFQKIEYTDFNAKKHGIVNDIEKYPYTSYHNHRCEHKTLLKVDSIKELF